MKKYLIISVTALLALNSCKSPQVAETSSKVVNNYATTTENIVKLEAGMTLSEVNESLDCEPTDLYSNIQNNEKIVVYKYRKNYQEVPVKQKDHEKYLRGGKPVFMEESSLYVIFDSKSNEMKYFITDSGRKSGKNEINAAWKLKLKKP